MSLKFQSKDLKKQNKSYSGKKKAHTFKVQVIIHHKTQKILRVCYCRGTVHDFELFKYNFNQINKIINIASFEEINYLKN